MFDHTKYNVNTEAIFLRLAPYFWVITPETKYEKEVWVAYLKLVASSLKNMQSELFNNATEFHNFLSYTGQHLSLEKYLNDDYDPALRRIYITENNVSYVNYIWFLEKETDPDNKVWYLQPETDPAPKTWYLQSQILYNFTVYIPVTLIINENELRTKLNRYIVNGYLFNIIYF